VLRLPPLAIACAIALALVFVACGDDSEDLPNDGDSPVIHTLAPLASTAPEVTAEFTTLQSGLQIATIAEGDGPQPTPGDVVTVNYSGWLQDGALFDSSLKEGRTPFQLVLGQGNVIKGWDEGIALMKVGGVYRLIIPPDLGYGAGGSGASIPPNSTLVFDVSVISTEKLTASPSPTPFATVNSTPPPLSAEPATLASGLQIITVTDGAGVLPATHDIVTLDYTGWAKDGGQFDTSAGRTPISFAVGEGKVIAGFDEGAALMKAGGSYRLIIPPDLGYGAQGSPPFIGPNATLIFDISVITIAAPSATP
jgi:peptidylprolyl isomerase